MASQDVFSELIRGNGIQSAVVSAMLLLLSVGAFVAPSARRHRVAGTMRVAVKQWLVTGVVIVLLVLVCGVFVVLSMLCGNL